MAKTIKFNLLLGGHPIRTIEDIQNHFHAEDLVDYYYNGLLQKWLKVHNYQQELTKVDLIDSKDPLIVIDSLQEIFGLGLTPEEVEKATYIYRYLKTREENLKAYAQVEHSQNEAIEECRQGYLNCINSILVSSGQNAAQIKALISAISSDYRRFFELDYRRVFYLFYEKSALAVMCLLMNPYTRSFYIPSDDDVKSDNKYLAEDKDTMYKMICDLPNKSTFVSELGDNLKTYSQQTEQYWHDLEPKGKNFMIISIGFGDRVRPLGDSTQSYSMSSVNGKYPIFDGIDYESNSVSTSIRYMEA